MREHCFKFSALSGPEMTCIRMGLGFFERHGVRITYRRRTVYIHLTEEQRLCALANVIDNWASALRLKGSDGRLTASQDAVAWMRSWHPIRDFNYEIRKKAA